MTLNRDSCLATIVLTLRDKTIRPSKRLAIILAFMGGEGKTLCEGRKQKPKPKNG